MRPRCESLNPEPDRFGKHWRCIRREAHQREHRDWPGHSWTCAGYQQAYKTLAEIEADAIRESFARHDGNRRAMCKELGISKSTLWRKLIAMGMGAPPKTPEAPAAPEATSA